MDVTCFGLRSHKQRIKVTCIISYDHIVYFLKIFYLTFWKKPLIYSYIPYMV